MKQNIIMEENNNFPTYLFGVYSPDEDLVAVHRTEEGAIQNKDHYENHHGEGFYVDIVLIHP